MEKRRREIARCANDNALLSCSFVFTRINQQRTLTGFVSSLFFCQHDGRLFDGTDALEEVAHGVVLIGGDGCGANGKGARKQQLAVFRFVSCDVSAEWRFDTFCDV